MIRLEEGIASKMGAFAKSPSFTVPEGERFALPSVDGAEQEMAFEPIEAQFSVPIAEIPTMTAEQLLVKLDRIATEMAKQQHERIMKELDRAATRLPKEPGSDAEPLSPDQIFRLLDKIWMDFDAQGQAEFPTLLIHPDLEPRAREVLDLIENDSALRQRFREIISRKREEWRDRESCRKLVG